MTNHETNISTAEPFAESLVAMDNGELMAAGYQVDMLHNQSMEYRLKDLLPLEQPTTSNQLLAVIDLQGTPVQVYSHDKGARQKGIYLAASEFAPRHTDPGDHAQGGAGAKVPVFLEETSLALGRAEKYAAELDIADNSLVSRNHAQVFLRFDGVNQILGFADTSLNGSRVIVKEVEPAPQHITSARVAKLGHTAIQ